MSDWMLFENMGAYTVAIGSTFSGFQRPSITVKAAIHEADPDTWLPTGSGGARCWPSAHVFCP